MAKHYPPAVLRYREKHPTLSLHVTKEELEILRALSAETGKSVNQLIKEAIGIAQKELVDLEKIKRESFDAGRQEGLNTDDKVI